MAVENPPSLEEARAWVGHKLDDMSGSTSGRVEGAFVDSVSGEPVWLVIRIGRLGHRSVVPFDLVAAGVGHVWVPFSREAIKAAPEVDPAVGIDPAREAELCAHYGIAPGAGRMAELEGREESLQLASGLGPLSRAPRPPRFGALAGPSSGEISSA